MMERFNNVCSWCGGTLKRIDNSTFQCEYCGHTEIVKANNNETLTRNFKLHLDYSGNIVEYDIEKNVTIVAEYRKRVTMADIEPMTISIILDDDKITIFEKAENVGAGEIKLTQNDKGIRISKTGKLIVLVNGKSLTQSIDISNDDVIQFGSIKMLAQY